MTTFVLAAALSLAASTSNPTTTGSAAAIAAATTMTAVTQQIPPGQARTLTGRVTDAASGSPLRARIDIVDTGRAVTCDATGAFSVDTGNAPRVTLGVSFDGYYVERVTIDTAAVHPLEIRLSAIVSVTDRVEVTATRVRDGADAASFTNVSRQQIADAYWAQDPAMLLAQVVPGLYATNDSGNGIGYSYFSIRGFGQARTRVMLNGAPLNDAESGELFFIDLADFMATSGDVQVQRGVAGLSGLGGAIDITTAQPSPTPSFTLSAGAGSFGTQRYAVNWDSGLITGRWAMSARYSKITTDGYRDQSWVDSWNYYLALARFGDRSRTRFVLFGGPERTHLAYEGVPRAALDGTVTGDADTDRRANPISFPGEIDQFFQPHYQVVHELDLGPSTRLSQTAYLFQGDGYYEQFRSKRSLVEYNLAHVVLPDGTRITKSDLVRRRNVDEWDAGWVPTLTTTHGRVSLDLKGELRIHRAHHEGTVRWAQYYPLGQAPNQRYYDYQVHKNTGAAAADVRFQATPSLSVSGGLQVTHHACTLTKDLMKGVTLSPTYTFLLPRAGVVWTLGERGSVYGRVARGMREPFFRNIYDPQDYYAVPVELDPEDVWNVEAGVSGRGDRWRARANTFWMRFTNEIVYAGALDDNGVPVYGNGAQSRRIGAEMDGSVTLAPHLAAEGALTLSRNTFTAFREFDWSAGTTVYDGNRIAGFPDVMASLALKAAWDRGSATFGVRHIGSFFLDNTQNDQRINDAYTVADLSGSITLPSGLARSLGASAMSLTARVNNLFDARYTTFGYMDGDALYIPAASRNVFVGFSVGM